MADKKYTSKFHRSLKLNLTNDIYGIALRKGGCIFLTGSCPTPTPKAVYEELLQAFIDENKFCSYNTGALPLRNQVAKYIKEHSNFDVDPTKNIMITLGATTFLQQLFLYLLDDESDCVVITPTFQDFFNQLRFTQTNIIEVSMHEKRTGWILNTSEVEKAITPKTRLILVCNPNNPTGKVYSKEEIAELGNIAKKHGIFLVADEAYNFLTYDKPFVSLMDIPEIRENIIVARTCSKEFSMCGWRIGFAYLPEKQCDEMFHLQLSFNSVAPAISQKAAEICLRSPMVKELVKEEVERIRINRDYVVKKIRAIDKGLTCYVPEACPYLFVNYHRNIPSYDLCKDIVIKNSVIVSPGKNNGKGGEGHFCITFADCKEVIEEGMNRLEKYFKARF